MWGGKRGSGVGEDGGSCVVRGVLEEVGVLGCEVGGKWERMGEGEKRIEEGEKRSKSIPLAPLLAGARPLEVLD